MDISHAICGNYIVCLRCVRDCPIKNESAIYIYIYVHHFHTAVRSCTSTIGFLDSWYELEAKFIPAQKSHMSRKRCHSNQLGYSLTFYEQKNVAVLNRIDYF